MSDVSSSAPLHGSRYPLSAARGASTQAAGATAATAKTFGRELGELNRMQRAAQQKGEVVTKANIELKFQLEGRVLAARDAKTVFDSKEPSPTPLEISGVTTTPAETAPPEAPPAEKPSTPPAVVRSEKTERLNQTLHRPEKPAGAGQEAPPPAIDTSA